MENCGADALGLVEAVDSAHEFVVVGIPDGSDRELDALDGQVRAVNRIEVYWLPASE